MNLPRARAISIGPCELNAIDVHNLRGHVVVVFQNSHLFHATFGENIPHSHDTLVENVSLILDEPTSATPECVCTAIKIDDSEFYGIGDPTAER
jgi:hypothetical protein